MTDPAAAARVAVRQATENLKLANRLALHQPTADFLQLQAETAARFAQTQHQLLTPAPCQ